MAIINRSHLSDKKIAKLLNFCRTKKNIIDEIDIIFKNCKNSPYSAGFFYGNYKRPKIIIRFTDKEKDWFPLVFNLRRDKIARTGYEGAYSFPCLNSCLIFIFFHEYAHALQHADPIKKFWLYHDLKSAEQDADKFAFSKLKKYLKLKAAGIDPLK